MPLDVFYLLIVGSFSTRIWAGVELETMAGKNDGTVAGVRYFECEPKHGVFAPLAKVQR